MSAETEILERNDAALRERARGLYEGDLAEWALREADLIRARRFDQVDLANLVEEVESLGRDQYAKLRSSFRVVLVHFLKWDHQPERRTRSWTLSIREGRDGVEDTVESSPSLRPRRADAIAAAYRSARTRAALETDLNLSTFPEQCPYSLDEIMTRRILWHDD